VDSLANLLVLEHELDLRAGFHRKLLSVLMQLIAQQHSPAQKVEQLDALITEKVHQVISMTKFQGCVSVITT
jgi:hypothetical protein